MFENFVPAITAIGGIAVGFLLNVLKDYIQRKADSKEKFFYEVYIKRVAAYDDVIKSLMVMGRKDRDILDPHASFASVLKKIEDDLHTLDGLRARLELHGSPAARNVISILRVEAGECFRAVALEPDNFVHNCVAFLDVIVDARNQFIGFIRKETGADMADKKIAEINKITMIPKKPINKIKNIANGKSKNKKE